MDARRSVRWTELYPDLYALRVDGRTVVPVEQKTQFGAADGVFGGAATLPPDLLGDYWDQANDRSPSPPRIEPGA
jgi:hypothetical protein